MRGTRTDLASPVRECTPPQMAILVEVWSLKGHPGWGKLAVPYDHAPQTWFVCRDGAGAYLSQRANEDALARIDLPWSTPAVRTSMISVLPQRSASTRPHEHAWSKWRAMDAEVRRFGRLMGHAAVQVRWCDECGYIQQERIQ